MKSALLISSLCLFSTLLPAQGQRIYVQNTATGTNTGQSWPNAYPDLQTALQAAQAGDSLWIAAGTYYPTTSTDRSISFAPVSGVRLFGGFQGTETKLEQRDWLAYPTILSGDIGLADDSTDNTINVLYLFQPDSTTVLDGLVIRDGVANDIVNAGLTHSRFICGGGVYVDATGGAAYPEIRNCRFVHNAALYFGGGIMVENGSDGSIGPRLVNCTFDHNRAGKDGGGLARYGASQIERGADMDGCLFTNNYAVNRGGGFVFTDAIDGKDSLDIQHCRLENNYAGSTGGGCFLFLGHEGKNRFNLHNTDFIANISQNDAAFFITNTGGLYLGDIKIDSCTFKNNKSLTGSIVNVAMLATSQSTLSIINSRLQQNTALINVIFWAFYQGTGLIKNTTFENNINAKALNFADFMEVTLDNCLFYNNLLSLNNAIAYHGAVSKIHYINSIFNNNTFQGGTLLNFSGSDTCTIENCVVNHSYASRFANNSLKNLVVYNSFVDSAVGNQYFYQPATTTHLANSYLKGFDCTLQNPNVHCDGPILTGGDPLFVDAAGGDFRLQPCSPLVNAGSNALLSAGNTTDLNAQPRVQGGTVDIGAYETPAPQLAAAPLISPACPGAANGSVVLEPLAGCAPYQVNWTSTSGSGQDLQNLAAGDYLFTITDARGSIYTFPLSVPAGSNLALRAAASPVVCGDTIGGSASVAVNNGTAPFTFQWPNSSDSLLTQLPAGNYPVTVTDANGCTATAAVTVGKTGGLQIDVEVLNVSCYGTADGSLTVVPLNGKAPFQWQWQNGPATPTYAPLAPGNYQGSISDAFGCSLLYILPVTQPDSLAFEATVTFSSDSLVGNGSIQLGSISGGTAPYHALWSNGQTGLAVHELPPGTYGVALFDDNGCVKFQSYTVGFTSAVDGEGGTPAITLFPSPADQRVFVRGLEHNDLVVVQDVMGRQIHPASHLDALEVQDWPAGLYYLSVLGTGRPHWRGVFVVQH